MSPEPRVRDRELGGDASEERSARRRGPRIVKLALLGGAVALLVSEDVRNHLLDALFGAEEEFDYSSLTEPPEPSAPPARSPSEPFVRTTSEPEDAPPSDARETEEPAPVTPRVTSSVAPSPAAWRAAAAAAEEPQVVEAPASDGEHHREPPAPPAEWWSPSRPGSDPA